MPLTAIERKFEPDGSEHYRTDIIKDPSKLEPAFLARVLGISLDELKRDLGSREGFADYAHILAAARLAASEKPLGCREPGKRVFIDDLKNGGVFHLMADDGTLHREFIIRQPAPINNPPPA